MATDGSSPHPPPLIIVGMHRSGTSLTTALLESAGLNIGERLMKGNWTNPRGHFEDLDFVEFHKAALTELGLHSDGWALENIADVPEHLVAECQTLIERKRESGRPWGWKDPRTVLFLRVWSRLLPDAKYVWVYRAPWQVIDSLYRRANEVFEGDPELALQAWLHYNRTLLQAANQSPETWTCANLSTVVARPSDWVALVSAKSGVVLGAPDAGRIDGSLLHSALADDRVELLEEHFPEVMELYNALEARAWRPTEFEAPPLPAVPRTAQARRASALRDWQCVGALAFERARGSGAAQGERRQSAPETGVRAPSLSIVVVVHDMPEQAKRTLYSLSTDYQSEVAADAYEVIVVENASPRMLGREAALGFRMNARYFVRDEPGRTPVGAANFGVSEAKAPHVAVVIDGARMLTPGVLKWTLRGLRIASEPVVAVPGYHLGSELQQRAVEQGYDETAEAALLRSIDWPSAGYRLFDVSCLSSSCRGGLLRPFAESNFLCFSKQLFQKLGGYDPGFDRAGGGYCNLDLYNRLCDCPDVTLIVLPGEGTFHQYHGGVTTGGTRGDTRERIMGENRDQYESMRGRRYELPKREAILLGHIPQNARRFLSPNQPASAYVSTTAGPDATAVHQPSGHLAACNICGETSFRPGPLGRLTRDGLAPVCCGCGSLERHRIFRSILSELRDAGFSSWSCLSIGKDPSVAADWFCRHEFSSFNAENSIDIQAIDGSDCTYDLVICNHVLQNVPDYRRAIAELGCIVKPRGLLFLSFPNPLVRTKTDDWGYPKVHQHGHYRVFGRDVEEVFSERLPDFHAVRVEGADSATGVRDMAYILTRSDQILVHLFRKGIEASIARVGRASDRTRDDGSEM